MLELTLSHDGSEWLVRGQGFRLSAASLEELDAACAEQLRANGTLSPNTTLQIRMCFDSAALPTWMRQYAQHYFNRIVAVNG